LQKGAKVNRVFDRQRASFRLGPKRVGHFCSGRLHDLQNDIVCQSTRQRFEFINQKSMDIFRTGNVTAAPAGAIGQRVQELIIPLFADPHRANPNALFRRLICQVDTLLVISVCMTVGQ